MGRRHKGYRPPPLPVFDHEAMFIETAHGIARGAAILDAYRKSTGLLLEANRSLPAVESLKAAAQHSAAKLPYFYRHDWARAMEHAGKHALCAYVGGWWTAILCRDAPETIAPGDEFYSYETIRRIIENHATVEPDKRG